MDPFVEPTPTDNDNKEVDTTLAGNVISPIEPYNPGGQIISNDAYLKPVVPGEPIDLPSNLAGNNNPSALSKQNKSKGGFGIFKIVIFLVLSLTVFTVGYYVGDSLSKDEKDSDNTSNSNNNNDSVDNNTEDNEDTEPEDEEDNETNEDEVEIPVGEIIKPINNEVINGKINISGAVDAKENLSIEIYDFYNTLLAKQDLTNFTVGESDILFEEIINLSVPPTEKIGIIKLFYNNREKVLLDSVPIKFFVSGSSNALLKVLAPLPNQTLTDSSLILIAELNADEALDYRLIIESETAEELHLEDIKLAPISAGTDQFKEIINLSEIDFGKNETVNLKIFEINQENGTISAPIEIPLTLKLENKDEFENQTENNTEETTETDVVIEENTETPE